MPESDMDLDPSAILWTFCISSLLSGKVERKMAKEKTIAFHHYVPK
jgi:hypothetical protein